MRISDVIAIGTSFITTCVLLPPILRFAKKHELWDPAGPLKIHTAPTPRLGGIAIAAGLLAGTSISTTVAPGLRMLYVPLVLVWAAGLLDDLMGLSPWVRLIVQAAAGALIWHSGWSLPIAYEGWSLLATVLFIVAFINALNMLDGADGLAAGVSAMISLGFILSTSLQVDAWVRALEFSLLGSCISFLLFNFPPAKIFMGDSGSTVLGFVVAILSLNFYRQKSASHVALLVPILFAGVPLLDAACAVVRRLRRGVSPFVGDREHSYDLLLKRGWSARKVAFALYALTAMLVSVGLFCESL